jgi:hypothetical protein
MERLKRKAKLLGADDLKVSNRQGKRLAVLYDDKWIHFGLSGGETYYDHRNKDKRKAWKQRHRKIKNKEGQFVINLKTSPSYWSDKILW